MGKSYVENSLKRFLKRKVKITLGLVVAFMITGVVSFAEGTEIKHEEHKNHNEWLEVEKAKEYLVNNKVTLTEVKTDGGINEKHFRKENGKDNYKIKVDGKDVNFEIKNPNHLTDISKANLNNTFALLDNTLNKNQFEKIEGLGDKYNKALDLKHTAKSIFKAENGETAIIDTTVKEEVEVQTANNGIIINKGILSKGQNGINNSEVYNFGLSGSQSVSNSTGYNYGIIYGNPQKATGSGVIYNYGLITAATFNSSGQSTEFEAYNYGIINYTGAYSTTTGQVVGKDKAKVYNYGLIKMVGASQSTNKNNTELYNYGNIEFLSQKGLANSNYSGSQVIYGGVENKGYNYGVINSYANRNNTVGGGQSITATGNNNMYNFGIINSNAIGQYIYTTKQGEQSPVVCNYGTINISKDNINTDAIEKGQYIKGYVAGDNSVITNNKAYNYGTINMADNSVGQYLEKSGEIYNFGTIKNENGTGYAMEIKDGSEGNYKAENYGIADVKNGKAFSGNIINRGFVITQDGTYTDNAWTGENKGVILKNDLTLGSTDKNQNVIDLSGKTGDIVLTDNKVTVGTNDLTDTDKTTVFMKNQNAQLTGTEYNNKNILAVVDDNNWNSSEAIIQAKDGTSLDLTNTVVTGYFAGEKGGTVLSTNSDLTLVGDTVISAVKGENVKEDVYALSLEKGTDGKSPMLTFVGNAQINGKINGKEGGISNVASHKFETTGGEIGKLQFRNANNEMMKAAGIKAEENYTNVTVGGGTDELIVNSLELSFRGTAKDKVNTVVLEENVKVTGDIDGTNSKYHEEDAKIPGLGAENKIDLTVNNLSNITGNITLGECDDKITVNNVEYSGTIDGNLGNDTLAVNPYTKTRADLENKLNYNIKNIETVELGNGNWTFGENLNISSDNADKNVTVKTTGTLTSYIGKDYKGSLVNNGNADITVAGQDKDKQGTVKYLMGQGFAVKDSITLDDVKIGENAEAESVVIYDSKVGADGKTTLTLKSAEDMGIKDSTDKKAYEILLGAIEGNDNLRNEFNGFTKKEDVVNRIEKTEKSAKAYYTSGYVVTKNIADTYSSIAEDFSKKAGKGEWLAQGKYINSDTEFDGGSKVKGYDGDITGTVGMIEYGVSDQASYGAVFGMGDTEVDIDGGGKLDGDNSYIGAFVKYRTLNGIDLIGNIGFAKSDLDSKLSNEFTIDGVTGSSVEFFDGSADSKAITLSLIGKKDFHIADTVRLQPKAGVRYNFIQQEEAKNEGMGFRIAAQDVTIIEGLAGMGIIKDIDLNSGKLALNTGVEYTMSNASKYDEMEYTLYGSKLELENSEMADSRGLFYVGFDYEHESGVGFNGKYEMIWSDTGDDSRVTAGVSYRF